MKIFYSVTIIYFVLNIGFVIYGIIDRKRLFGDDTKTLGFVAVLGFIALFASLVIFVIVSFELTKPYMIRYRYLKRLRKIKKAKVSKLINEQPRNIVELKL